MSELFNEEILEQLKEIFVQLSGKVELLYFTQEPACDSCRTQQLLLEVIAENSDKITLTQYDLIKDADKARGYGIHKVPATAVIGQQDFGIRFYGVTGGYEFNSLLEDILMVSSGEHDLDPGTMALVEKINRPTHLEVMVTLTCPYCPKMVRVVHQLAMANPMIRGDMVDASEFPQLVQRYQVGGVPRTVIDEGVGIEGALPVSQAVVEILKHVNPGAYREFDDQMRDYRGERHVSKADSEHLYDILVIGAGPAAMTATIYASRKARDVLVLGKDIGGQMVNTASIENWPGMSEVGGQELAELFRTHAERYPLAEQMNAVVTRIAKQADYFIASCDDGSEYKGRAVIYCAGKRYRQLGVPGEKRFIGRGIAFCATCDAPLYMRKRVAIVGGGNSAFTAARDLLNYAAEIHIINVTPDFQADPVLIEQVTANSKVSLHPSTHVWGFLGDKQLTGIRLESEVSQHRQDLAIEGAFLEIGLEPNTQPVADLVTLNEQYEVPVNRDQSTDVAGFFAAGDCTDEQDKQIVIAAGAGAKAGLATDRYLADTK
ncbi:MAG: FAD-dependent oxidoreductase [Gammaproteobacteria bacterium]|nr:FAD-dependent oxidoreductase [Gammaproteobacteria bacterium]